MGNTRSGVISGLDSNFTILPNFRPLINSELQSIIGRSHKIFDSDLLNVTSNDRKDKNVRNEITN